MKFTLIASNGKVLTFFIRAVAETYQKAYGGVIVTEEVLVDNKSKMLYTTCID
jgi:hypothetical protein